MKFKPLYAYRFSAKSQTTGQPVAGILFAPNAIFASHKARTYGFVTPVSSIDYFLTVKTLFGLAIPKEFDLRERERLYSTLGARLRGDGNLAKALNDAQEYITDGLLSSAIGVMAAQLADGQIPSLAMRNAGFPERDCMLVHALTQAGKLHQAYTDLGREAKARYTNNSTIAEALFMPKFMAVFIYIAIFIFLAYGAPLMTKFFSTIGGVQLSPFIGAIYGFSAYAAQWPKLFAGSWIALGAAIFYSGRFKIWSDIANKFKAWKTLSEKSEHLALWGVYSIMYDAAIPPAEICTVLRNTTRLPETSRALAIAAKNLRSGVDEASAIRKAYFPKFVINAYTSSKQSGRLTDELRRNCLNWEEDVHMSTVAVKKWLSLGSLFFMAALVMLGVSVFYLPMVLPILKML